MTTDPTTIPNAARIYDYLLGGTHNFDVDRVAATHLEQLVPTVRQGARLNRTFMLEAARLLSASHFSCYLDLATGLPTQGSLHTLLPDATVIYTDVDPITVAAGRAVIGDTPKVQYVQADIVAIDPILVAAEEHFQGTRTVGVCMIGIAYFLSDEQVRHVLDRLYGWCAPGSRLATSWLTLPADPTANLAAFLAEYAKMGVQVYGRTPADIQALLGSWQIAAPGLVPLTDWSLPGSGTDALVMERHEGPTLYGCIAEKPHERAV